MQRGGGGGGGGGQQMSQDLADLFELEQDKLANQYELQQHAEQQSADKKIDELADKLKELAQQQQEAERQRRMAASNGGGGGSSADQQRAIAQELEDAARRLEQLTRDQPKQNLADAAREMRDAANAMRQAAANGSQDGGAQATAALQKLRDAAQKLQQNQEGRGERDIQQAKRDADALASQEKDVASQVQNLDRAGLGEQAHQDRTKQIQQTKDQMDAQLGQLKDNVEKLANDMRHDEREAARKLDEASGSIADKRMREKIQYTRSALNGQSSEYAKAVEDDLGANLDALSQKIGEAQAAVGKQSQQDALGRAAEKAGELRRSLESAQQAQQGQQGQQGVTGARRVSKASRVRVKVSAVKVRRASRRKAVRDRVKGKGKGKGRVRGKVRARGKGKDSKHRTVRGKAKGRVKVRGQGQKNKGKVQGRGQGQGQGQGGGQPGQGGGLGGQQAGNNNGGYGAGPCNGGSLQSWRRQPAAAPHDRGGDSAEARRQAQEWQNDAQALRRELTNAGMSTRDFDAMMNDLKKSLDSPQACAVDAANLAALQAQALTTRSRISGVQPAEED